MTDKRLKKGLIYITYLSRALIVELDRCMEMPCIDSFKTELIFCLYFTFVDFMLGIAMEMLK